MTLYYPPTADFVQKTLDAELLSGVTASATLNNTTSLQNKLGVMIIDRVDSNGASTPAKVEVISFAGTSGSTVTTLTRGLAGTSDQDHAVGAVVEFGPDIVWAQGLLDTLLVEHETDGTHGAVTATSVTTDTITSESADTDLSLSGNGTGVVDVDGLKIASGTAMTSVKDEDDMASDSDTALATQQSIKAYVDANGGGGATGLFANALINGNMDVWQRGTSFTAATTPANNDDTWLTDRWLLLSDGNDVVDITQSTDKPDGSTYSMKLDVQTAQEFGICQILENKDTKPLDNKNVSFSFAAKSESGEITTLRVAILTWSGTADSVTSDVVGTWGATITPAANWTLENTPGDITITDSWATYSVENVAIDSATVNNLAVLIYTPNAESIGDTVYITQVKLNEGSAATTFSPQSYNKELRACQRYLFAATAPETNSTVTVGYNTGTTGARHLLPTPVTLRRNPTLSTTASGWAILHGGTATTCNGASISQKYSEAGVPIDWTVAAGLTAGQGSMSRATGTSSYIFLEAEL